MVIKSSKEYHIMALVLLLTIIAFGSILWTASMSPLAVAVIVSVFGDFVLRFWIGMGRTLIITRQGCTVQFLWYKRNYCWSELKTKQGDGSPALLARRRYDERGQLRLHLRRAREYAFCYRGWRVPHLHLRGQRVA